MLYNFYYLRAPVVEKVIDVANKMRNIMSCLWLQFSSTYIVSFTPGQHPWTGPVWHTNFMQQSYRIGKADSSVPPKCLTVAESNYNLVEVH